MGGQKDGRTGKRWIVPLLGICLAVSVCLNLCQLLDGGGPPQVRGTYVTPTELYASDYGRGAAQLVLTADHFYLYDVLSGQMVAEGGYVVAQDGQYLSMEVDGDLYMKAPLDGDTVYLPGQDGTSVVTVCRTCDFYVFPGDYPDSFEMGDAS